MGPHPREPRISGDPRAEFLARLADSLGGGRLARRRLLREIEDHLEDCVADLRLAGVPEDEALGDAMARLGEVDAIVGAFRATRSTRCRPWQRVARVPVAWIAVGAMSLVTLVAAELPQASGAKVSEPPVTHARVVHATGQRPRAIVTRRHTKTNSSRTCRCSRDVARGRWQN